MIGLLLVTIILMLAMLLSGMNMLGAIPLVLIPVSALVRSRWLGLIGLLGFCTLSLGTVKGGELADLPRFGALTASLVVPSVLLLELVLSDRTLRTEKVSLWPILVVLGLAAVWVITLIGLSRVQIIGVYLGSDPTLQVFVMMSLSILFSGPILLGSGTKVPPGTEKALQNPKNGHAINKNE